jgi:hypothetical protein
MQCKNHPNRPAVQFCASCGIALCGDCAEEAKSGEYYCFQCAMISSVSAVGTTILDKRDKVAEEKTKAKIKLTAFHYFVMASAVLILAMWGFILFGGQKPPTAKIDYTKNQRVFLFMVDSAIKRYAHYEGDNYPEKLLDLVPKYLVLGEKEVPHLIGLSYRKDPGVGYQLGLTNPNPGEMKITITSKGIQYQMPPGGGTK